MAVSITDNVTTRNDLDTSATFGTIGGGPGAAILTAMVYQGTNAAARRINATGTDHGFTITEGTTTNINTAGLEVFWFKGFLKQRGAINTAGMKLRLGSATTAYYEYTMGDDGTIPQPGYEYPIPGGFIVTPVYVGLRAWHDIVRTGSPDVTAIDVYAITANVSATANGEDLAMDALQWSGDGLFLTGGTPDGVFQDFLDADEGEGSATADRVGFWQSRGGVFFVFGTHVIGRTDTGTVTATQFTDTLQSIVFPASRTDTGFNGFEFDLGNASTTVDISSSTISGNGRSTLKRWFDTELNVTGGGTDTIGITAHGFIDGDQVQYSAEGGTEDIGPDATNGEGALVTGTTIPTGDRWYVIVSDVDTIQLASTYANALAGTATTLTASTAGNGEQHSLTRTPDTRPDITFTGTSGTADLTGCTLVSNNVTTLTSAATYTGCSFSTCGSIVLGSGTLNTCTISGATVAEGEAFITVSSSAELADIESCVIASGGRGHAIEITTTATTVSFPGNTFSSYATDPDVAGEGWQFDTETDVTGGATDTITYTGHGFTTGDPIYYSQEGIVSPEAIGLSEDVLYWVRADDANTIGVFLSETAATSNTNRISLTASTSGNGETHALYSANAAIHNSTGSAVTINVTSGGATPSVRNSNGSSTVVNNNTTITLTGMRDNTEVRVYRAGTTTEIAGIENVVDGSVDDRTFDFSDAAGNSVDIVVHNIEYVYIKISNFTIPATDSSIPIQQQFDRNYSNP
jgi:hypothetical protein